MTVTPLIFVAVLTPVAYKFAPDTSLAYDVAVGFNGFLPLFGGNEGKVDVKMSVAVKGGAPADGRLKATSEISAFEVSFNGAKLPLSVESVNEYFPKTTISLEPTGKIVENDAPPKKLPVRLPGLDVRHFPDITYVPIELPAEGVGPGREWAFTRDFGGAPIIYSCRAESVSDSACKIKVRLQQTYTVYEGSALDIVANKEDAVSEVTTSMTGEGIVDFDVQKGQVSSAEMSNTAVSQVKNLKTEETKERKLSTDYKIKLRTNAVVTQAPAQPTNGIWKVGPDWAAQAVQAGRNALVWFQTASLFGLRALPAQFEAWIQPLRPLLRRWWPAPY